MRRILFLLRFVFWIGVIGFFIWFPGIINVSWLGYHVSTSVLFVVVCFVLVEKVTSLFGKLIRYVFHDMRRDVALSYYKLEVKELQSREEKRLKKEKEAQLKEKEKRHQIRRKKWQAFKSRVKKRFHFN